MENQHRSIQGYRELNETEIALMNRVKALGVECGLVTDMLSRNASCDQRWVRIGITDMQQGLMALTRAVAQPTTF